MIKSRQTSAETLEIAKNLMATLSLEVILVNDSPGFVTNRVLMPMINEAIQLLEEGVSTPADIDQIFKACFGHKMGPLETADLIGLDTILLSLEVLYELQPQEKFRPAKLLRAMVAKGEYGRKSGRGFYHNY
jgi:3-hydroxybutyryl-CoA dehydrogenase